ncbi:helix-turn-helix transcriptional regulator [Thiohalobacter sp. IOR34]|uniref:helix-turn-helix domain-containing protein n=1 Tax=Thiohalobacter sp. IOR34 TaxID=3057176 RepID=UPI0025B0B615|nr:helix-turn-helix transcriptional regulator [Thiohalobacter sp. IOR34]WJW76602.1 helix-turn-helix transcriptional regulator [Thiohalobacter sp. IOR34]
MIDAGFNPMPEPSTTLLEQILAAARERGLTQQQLASRAGITPETLSRMKKRGSGELTTIERLAAIVGLRLSLLPDDDRLEALRQGRFFE